MDVPALSMLLLAVGVTGLAGVALIGHAVRASLRVTLVAMPLVMAGAALALALLGASVWAVAALLGLWGLAGVTPPVAWVTWLARTLPEDAEAGGGLMVAVIQLAITLGAAGGGPVFDAHGPVANVAASAGVLALAALVAMLAARMLPRGA